MYQLRELTLQNQDKEKRILVIDFDDPAMDIVSEFLMSDATLLNAVVLDDINAVLNEGRETVETSGNRCGLVIGKKYTDIYDLFADILVDLSLVSYCI